MISQPDVKEMLLSFLIVLALAMLFFSSRTFYTIDLLNQTIKENCPSASGLTAPNTDQNSICGDLIVPINDAKRIQEITARFLFLGGSLTLMFVVGVFLFERQRFRNVGVDA